MEASDRKKHWENIYSTKSPEEVSWYQPSPKLSLELITTAATSKAAAIIDIGGGDSLLVDALLTLGYSNLTVLDISENAIMRAKKRLGRKAGSVKWIISDIIDFKPDQHYNIWHDRAAFHFLNNANDISAYSTLAATAIVPEGKMIIGTFSKNGPEKCSGIGITQYDSQTLQTIFNDHFINTKCFTELHQTPFNTTQDFIFCNFSRKT